MSTTYAEAEDKPFVKKGAMALQENDGYLEMKVSPAFVVKLQERLDDALAQQKDKLDGDNVMGLAFLLKEAMSGSEQSIKVKGAGGESPSSYVFSYSESGWLDDVTDGQKYQYFLAKKGEEWRVTKVRAWVKPWADRYQGMKEYVKRDDVLWGK